MAVLAVLFLSTILFLPASWLPRVEHLTCPSFSQVALSARYGTSSSLQPHGCHFAPARWPSCVNACHVDTHCTSPGLQPIRHHPLPAHQLAGMLPRVNTHRIGTHVLRSSTSRMPLLASSTVGTPSHANTPCVGTHYCTSRTGCHCSPVGQLTSSHMLTCIAFHIARLTCFTACPFTHATVHIHWRQTICSRPLVSKLKRPNSLKSWLLS